MAAAYAANPANWQTPFSKKYGIRESDDRDPDQIFLGAQKSGFTPTQSRPLADISSRQAKITNATIAYQKEYLLKGFSARELVDLGAYPVPNAKDTSLQTGIHTIFERKRWETKEEPIYYDEPGDRCFSQIIVDDDDCYSHTKGEELGDWLISNPIVWKILEPCLKLASRFLVDIHTNAFIEAFFTGNWEQIKEKDDARGPAEIKAEPWWKFSNRNPASIDTEKSQKMLTEALKSLSEKLVWAIGSGRRSWTDNKGDSEFSHGWHGLTYELRGLVHVVLAYENLQPLLRNDLNTSERLAHQFLIAITILHELMHALRTLLEGSAPQHSHENESFYNNDVFAEMGFGLEKSLFGGGFEGRPGSLNGKPKVCWFVSKHPEYECQPDDPESLNELYLVTAEADVEQPWHRPVPVKYFVDIQTDEFWGHAVKKWGLAVVVPQCPFHTKLDPGDRNYYLKPSRQRAAWDSDLATVSKTYSDAAMVEKLADMAPEHRKPYEIALRAQTIDREIQERNEFQAGRVAGAQIIRNILDKLLIEMRRGTVSGRANIPDRLTDLLKTLDDQNLRIAKAIGTYVKSMNPASQFEEVLSRYNKNIRDIIERVRTEFLPALPKFKHWDQTTNKIISESNAAFVCLHLPKTVDPTIYNMTLGKMFQTIINKYATPDRVAQYVAEHDLPSQRARDDFIPTLLEEAKAAIIAKNASQCKTLALEIYKNFIHDPFLRAVSIILLANDGDQNHRGFSQNLSETEIEALVVGTNLTGSVDPTMRLWWCQWWEDNEEFQSNSPGLVVPMEGIALEAGAGTGTVNCSKRKREDGGDVKGGNKRGKIEREMKMPRFDGKR